MTAPGSRNHFNGVSSTYQPNPEHQSFTRPSPLASTLCETVAAFNAAPCYCVDCDDARIAADNARWAMAS